MQDKKDMCINILLKIAKEQEKEIEKLTIQKNAYGLVVEKVSSKSERVYYEVLARAISTFGSEQQENVLIEECAELIQAVNHKHRGRDHNISEEIADVEIMLDQAKIINNCHEEVEIIKQEKILRLCDRLGKGA